MESLRGAANLDGHALSVPFLLDPDGRGPAQPLVERTDAPSQPTDEDLARHNMTHEEFNRLTADRVTQVDDAMRSIAGASFRVTIPGVRHRSFSDLAAWDVGTEEERHRRMQIIRDYVRAFFDKTLLGKPHTLLDMETSACAEVKVERFSDAK